MNIAIIGAGAAGLAAAWDLADAGHEVTIYEAADRVGGLAAGFKDDAWDWTLEKFYHHWFATDHDILALAAEMGARDRIIFPRPKTSYWLDGKPVRSEISPSALFLPLSLASTLRMALAGMYLKLTPRWQPFERVTADQWMRRWMGQEAYEKFFKPLLIGKFAEQYDQVPMSFMWARIVKRTLKLGTYVGGFQAFLDELARQLRAKGVTIHLNAPVESIEQARRQAGFDNRARANRIRSRAEHDIAASAAAPGGRLGADRLWQTGRGAEEHRRALRHLRAEGAAHAR